MYRDRSQSGTVLYVDLVENVSCGFFAQDSILIHFIWPHRGARSKMEREKRI